MMKKKSLVRTRNNERGQTIILVAVSLVSLFAIAALAIDVAALYSARGEAQRTADAVALAGAKAFVDSGYTTADPSNVAIKTLAEGMATDYINAALSENKVSGSAANLQGAPVY